jgi:hypothetical protein
MVLRAGVTFSENVTRMTLLSAYEDFVGQTLRSVPTRFARLRYFCHLCSGDGYLHWGLAQVYGEHAAQSAVSRAHRDLISDILRTPMRTLHEDAGQNQVEDFGELLKCSRKLLPQDASRAEELHLKSVLLALSRLSRRHATDQVA